MRVWRIARPVRAAAPLSGIGGLHVSGRWHHRGHAIVYASATPSLAALEVLVHVDPALAPTNLRLFEIHVPDDLTIDTCDPISLTEDWQSHPAPSVLQDFGTKWLVQLSTAVLCVPSAVIAVERNYLLNPNHPDASRFRVISEQAFTFDPRLLQP
jgi:RES domain-containing protein